MVFSSYQHIVEHSRIGKENLRRSSPYLRSCYELWIMRCSISVRTIFFVSFPIIYCIGNLFRKGFAPSMNTFLLTFHQRIQRIKENGLNTIFHIGLSQVLQYRNHKTFSFTRSCSRGNNNGLWSRREHSSPAFGLMLIRMPV